MLKKKIGKVLTASAVTACMVVNATAAMLPSISLTAFAGEELGNNEFDNGYGLPWHICESGPGKLRFDIDNGTYNIEIVEPGGAEKGGESRWDCQFRHRSLILESGHKYTVKAEVTSDQTGEIYTKIGDSGEPYREVWHNGYGLNDGGGDEWKCMPISAGETLKIDSSFTCSEDILVGEWAWQFGGQGQYQEKDCFPAGTKLTFDNMYLTDETDGTTDWFTRFPKAQVQENNVHVNQVGYFTKLKKQATLHDSKSTSAVAFSILDSSGKEVYTGTSTPKGADTDSGMNVQILDFSDFQTPGKGYTISCEGGTSYAFDIGDDVYDGILTNAVNYYYQNRSGITIEEKYITSSAADADNPSKIEAAQDKASLAHKGGHNPDTAAIQTKWVKSYTADGSDIETGSSLDCTGGWYDAGDHGKYVVNGGISVWTLQNMYERAVAKGSDKFDDNSGVVVIPETGNKIPDILDETKVELDFFFKMIADSSYKMSVYDVKDADGKPIGGDTKKYTNMVFHKMHDHKWTGLAVRAYDYETEWKTKRIVKPVSTAATLNLVACAAQAARLFEASDPAYAKTCLENAEKCYEAALANPELYAPLDQAIGGGAYGDSEVRDDFYWAECELYATTGDEKYLTALKKYKDAFKLTSNLAGGENNGSFSSFNWGCTAGLGTVSLYMNADKLDAADAKTITDSICATADEYIEEENKQGFGIPYHGAAFTDAINIGKDANGNLIEVIGYEWGSNSFVINNAMVMAYAYDIAQDVKYINGVTTAMDYIFGRNALDYSYVTGYGEYHCQNPHHRLWSYQLDSSFPMAPRGVMSGGANSGMQDPYIAGAGYKRGKVAPQLCYIDSVESWSTNEVTINWNAPFAWVMSFLEDEAADPSSTPGTTTTVKPGTTTAQVNPGKTLYGDVDCNEVVAIADVVLLARYVSQDSELAAGTVSSQGKINADVNVDEQIASDDISNISRFLAGFVTLPVTD